MPTVIWFQKVSSPYMYSATIFVLSVNWFLNNIEKTNLSYLLFDFNLNPFFDEKQFI